MRSNRGRRPWTRCKKRDRLRRGAAVVEMALIGPAVVLMLIGLAVLELGAFRMNQVAAMAQEGARWAAVHGATYDSLNNRTTPVNSTDLYTAVIKPRAVGFDPQKLTYELKWAEDRRTATVTVSYRWLPEAYFGERTFSSVATVIVSN